MIKINPDPTFTEDVEITVPGKKAVEKLNLTFRYRGFDEYVKWHKSFQPPDGVEIDINKRAAAFMDCVVGWELEEKLDTENTIRFLNNYPHAFSEIVGAYSKLLLESRVKN